MDRSKRCVLISWKSSRRATVFTVRPESPRLSQIIKEGGKEDEEEVEGKEKEEKRKKRKVTESYV